MHNKTIFLYVPNYVYTTDLIRTDFLALIAKETRVVVFLPTLEYVGTFPQVANVEYRVWKVSSMRFWGYMKTLRIGLIREFDGLQAVKVHYLTSFSDWRRKWLRVISKILPFKLGAHFFTRLEQRLLPMRGDFEQIVQEYNPSLILTCSPGFTDFESEAIVLAKKCKIPTVAVNFSWDNLTTNSKHIRHTDFLITWNEFMKKEAIRYHGYKDERVFVSGSMRFDRYFRNKSTGTKQSFLVSKKLDPDLPLVTLTTTSHGVYPYHSELIRELLKIRELGTVSYFNLLVRAHPKDDISRYDEFSLYKNVCLEIPGHTRKQTGDSRHKIELEEADMENLQNTLTYSNLVVNYWSTILLEALACGADVLTISFPKSDTRKHWEYEHLQPIRDSGAIRIADDESELEDQIKKHFAHPHEKKERSRYILESFFFRMDGKSTERCGRIVLDIVANL